MYRFKVNTDLLVKQITLKGTRTRLSTYTVQ